MIRSGSRDLADYSGQLLRHKFLVLYFAVLGKAGAKASTYHYWPFVAHGGLSEDTCNNPATQVAGLEDIVKSWACQGLFQYWKYLQFNVTL
jgi:hypothetical protein